MMYGAEPRREATGFLAAKWRDCAPVGIRTACSLTVAAAAACFLVITYDGARLSGIRWNAPGGESKSDVFKTSFACWIPEHEPKRWLMDRLSGERDLASLDLPKETKTHESLRAALLFDGLDRGAVPDSGDEIAEPVPSDDGIEGKKGVGENIVADSTRKKERAGGAVAGSGGVSKESASAVGADEEFARPPRSIMRAILAAAETVGTDPALMLAIAHRESRFRSAVTNRKSSATGLYQFTNATWLRVVKEFGSRHGLASASKAIFLLKDGRVGVRGQKQRGRILELRKDAAVSSLMAAELVRDNGKRLARLIGRDVDTTDLYLAHFLGVGNAAKFITAVEKHPGRRADKVVPKAARANPGIFAPGGRMRSVAEVHDAIAASIEARRRMFESVLVAMTDS